MKQIEWSESVKAHVWTILIAQKIYNQAKVLKNFDFINKSQSIIDLYKQLQINDPSNREGHAARIYFNTLFGNNFSRETDCDINAGLDYGYSILLSIVAREIVACGCITQLGIRHSNQFNPYNLASDLMEPFRPIVDRIIFNVKDLDFQKMKLFIFKMFDMTFYYDDKEMYLTNLISDFIKKVVKALNSNGEGVPIFEL